MQQQLQERYNIELIFLPIPNKISIYHNLVTDRAYNNLLPRIYEGLAQRNVKCIDVYHPFLSAPETLYYSTDTHWNKAGVDYALNASLHYLDSIGVIDLDTLPK